MPIITLKHNGTIYQRNIERQGRGIYIMTSKGKQYWFRKDADVSTNHGWHLVNGESLPDFMIELISEELEKLSRQIPPCCINTFNNPLKNPPPASFADAKFNIPILELDLF